MYHVFTARDEEADEEPNKRPAAPSRRISTTHACTECRRRKLRCGGSQPCQQCRWSRTPQLCTFAQPARKPPVTRDLVDRLQSELAQLSCLRERLFPGQSIPDLLNLSHTQLVHRALALLPTQPSSQPSPLLQPSPGPSDAMHPYATSPDPISNVRPPAPAPAAAATDSASLDALEHLPDLHPSVDETIRRRRADHGISDDVNGLSLSTDRNSSYVGVSSIQAALKVIFTISPTARAHVSSASMVTSNPSRVPSPLPDQLSSSTLPSPDVAHRLIDAFFNRVHTLVPLLDEDAFRHTFLYLHRRDAPWLALLNVVLALGSLALGTCYDHDHLLYYRRANFHLQSEGFGSGHLDVLQAYGLIAGYYLHWLNRPNEASAIMGATFRMASAMGLHREFATSGNDLEAQTQIELRRRIWWCLFTMDTWAHMTTGRPSQGRMGTGVTIKIPRIAECTNNAQYLASLKRLPLVHSVRFCILATRIQDSLAASPILDLEEVATVDAELVQWHNDMPPVLRDADQLPRGSNQEHGQTHIFETCRDDVGSILSKEPVSNPSAAHHQSQTTCPEILQTPRLVMHWWYLTMRLLLYRPYLLTASLRGHPRIVSSVEESAAVDKCCSIAGEMIENINFSCPGELIAGWNAVWLMYQAVMVPLLSLHSRRRDRSSLTETHTGPVAASLLDDHKLSDRGVLASQDEQDKLVWSHQVEMAIRFFDRMSAFSIAAGKSKSVVESLYESSKILSTLPYTTLPQTISSCQILGS
ncbi:hypothetical protein M409DRAFT_68696 [Zasmidium cellare ATCC 36951]|uniref:Zn(2)-C6 fungal-type domain-containing protein n=1 Tax=Zasmidium cellare ATCC 36951 TaxID=1080233 RepID=A0A6A6C9Y8_ZASCE|nr:uncharacterized protein M409DRAFT_68696 [Zasmidium cellare ATCC 36951]KAF2163058.1 hypothetical protein M409DRAFT_68696 [Zasmidium cellare ATCC 36951]